MSEAAPHFRQQKGSVQFFISFNFFCYVAAISQRVGRQICFAQEKLPAQRNCRLSEFNCNFLAFLGHCVHFANAHYIHLHLKVIRLHINTVDHQFGGGGG